MRSKRYCACQVLRYCVVAIAICSSSDNDGLAQGNGSSFTQAEVTAGHASYHGWCAGCHGDALQGAGSQGGDDAPQLAGPNFNQDWSKYTIRVLYQYVSKTMPDGLAGDLSAKTYSNVLAFLLAANGATPGSTPFDPNRSAKIGDLTSGRIVTAVTDAPIDLQAGAAQ